MAQLKDSKINGSLEVVGDIIMQTAGETDYRPYYKAGDIIDFTDSRDDNGNEIKNAVRTAGYVTNDGRDVTFTIHLTKPIIGSPTITIEKGKGFVLRQNNNYTHSSGATTFVEPAAYNVFLGNSGLILTACFEFANEKEASDVINNDAIGIYWDGKIILS